MPWFIPAMIAAATAVASRNKTQSVPSTTTQVSRTEIPEFLKPLFQAQADLGLESLYGLREATASGLPNYNVAGFSPLQQQSFDMIQNMPTGQAQTMLRNALANPNGVYQNSLDGLKNIGRGGWIDKMMPTFNNGIDQAINGQFIPGSATNPLDSFAMNGYQMPGVSQTALAQSAAGGNLYGTPAFSEAVQASMRQAQPMIASTFAGAGSGGLKSGLAQIGMQQAASDAFARLYGDERNRQLSSAQQLGNFGLAGRDQQINAATQRGNLALGEQGLRTQATLGLGGLMSQERSRQLDALKSAPGIGLMGVNALNDMENQQFGQRMSQVLAMNEFGGQQQAYAQDVFDAERMNAMNPIVLQQMLYAASQGLPIDSLMGQNTSGTSTNTVYRNPAAGMFGGALTGAQLGSMFGLTGTPLGWAAAAGGLLGAF